MATITLLHVLGVLFGAAMCYRAWTFFDAATERPLAFVVWAGFGAGLLAYTAGTLVAPVALHGVLDVTLGAVGIGGWSALVSVTLAGVTMLALYTYTRVRAGDRQLAEAQQEIALLRYEVEYGGRGREGVRGGSDTAASGDDGSAAATDAGGGAAATAADARSTPPDGDGRVDVEDDPGDRRHQGTEPGRPGADPTESDGGTDSGVAAGGGADGSD